MVQIPVGDDCFGFEASTDANIATIACTSVADGLSTL
jgi:hypothetical protein